MEQSGPFDGAPGTPRPWWQDWGAAVPVLCIIYAFAYIGYRAQDTSADLIARIIARLLFLPLNIAACALAWRAARRPDMDPRARRALHYIGAAFACVFAGNVVAFYLGLVLGGDPGASWINIFYFPFYPLVLLGLLSFPLAQRQRHEHWKFLLDAAAALLAGGLAIWYFVVRPTTMAEHLGALGSAIALAYPLGDILVLLGLTTYMLRQPRDAPGRMRRLLIAGIAIYVLCDLANDLAFLQYGWGRLNWTELIYLVAYCTVIAALAGFQWPDSPAARESAEAETVHSFSLLPYGMIAFVCLLVLVMALRRWPDPQSVLTVGVLAAGLLVTLRQVGAVRENARLIEERAAREGEKRFRALVQHSSDVIAVVDAEGSVTYVSPSVSQLIGFEPAEMVGSPITAFLEPEFLPEVEKLLLLARTQTGATPRSEWHLRHRLGHRVCIETVGTNLLREPAVRGIVLNARSINERKALEAQLVHQAFHDPLTGLANRVLFLDRVSHALMLVRRHDQMLAVLFVDLDGFKVVNDSLGHLAGDRLLVAVSQRLQTCVRDSDTVARIGGDEFALLIEDSTDAHAAVAVAERVANAVKHPLQVEGRDVFLTASVGIVTATGEESAGDLLRNADVAMYAAKSKGKSRHETFAPEMYERTRERLELQGELRHALEDASEFTLLYQPIVELRTGHVTGVEALVRWLHPERGTLTPAQFIPLAEETGLIVPLGRWVLFEACRQVRRWQTAGEGAEALTLTVNVSGHQLQYEGVVDDVRDALEESGLDPAHLVLEITESVLMQENVVILERLRALKSLGIRLAIDDFGTGYSSLGYLQRFPVDILKIDKAFVDDIGPGRLESGLVRAIIGLGETLHLQTIAEGIEQEQQRDGLQTLGCDMGQGYFFAHPVPVAEIDSLLSDATERGVAAALPCGP